MLRIEFKSKGAIPYTPNFEIFRSVIRNDTSIELQTR